MTDRARALDKILGLGLWNKPPAVATVLASELWRGYSPKRLGTLSLLQDLRDEVQRRTTGWDPKTRYGHISEEDYLSKDPMIARLLDQLHPIRELQPLDQEALRAYQDDPYSFRSYRERARPTDREQRLRDLVVSSELPVDLNTYRGTTVHRSSSPDRVPLFTPPREGDVLGTRGFMSTSPDPSSAHDFVQGDVGSTNYLADIYLPAGTPAHPVATGHQYDVEKELLLGPGQRFRVASDPELFGDAQNPLHRLRLEALHPSDPYEAPSELHTLPGTEGGASTLPGYHTLNPDERASADRIFAATLGKNMTPRLPRGRYATDKVYGYLAGLGPLAALATPGIMDLYQKDTQ